MSVHAVACDLLSAPLVFPSLELIHVVMFEPKGTCGSGLSKRTRNPVTSSRDTQEGVKSVIHTV